MTHLDMTEGSAKVVVGVDTHADNHVAAALDSLGRTIGRLEVATTPPVYGRLLTWSRDFDPNVVFGIDSPLQALAAPLSLASGDARIHKSASVVSHGVRRPR